jgi:hypothetical protein
MATPTRELPKGDGLVFKVSRWDKAQWGYFLEGDPEVYDGIETDLKERSEDGPVHPMEMFARMMRDEVPKKDPPSVGSEWDANAHETADGLSDFQSLCERTRGKPFESACATLAIVEEVLKTIPKPEKPVESPQKKKQTVENLQALKDAGNDEISDEMIADAQAALDAALAGAAGLVPDPDKMRIALRAGVAAAHEAVDKAEKVQAMLGRAPGSSMGTITQGMDLKLIAAMAKKIGENDTLKRIADLLGKVTNIVLSKNRTRVARAPGEIYGVCMSDEVQDAIPDEFAMFAGGEGGRSMFAANLADRSILTYEMRGEKDLGRGPIVMLKDISGSMEDRVDPSQPSAHEAAAAIELSLLMLARSQKRDFCAKHFDTRVRVTHEWMRGEVSAAELLAAIDHRSQGGGTNFMAPLNEAADLIGSAKWNQADIILVTDGCANITDDFERTFRAKMKARDAEVRAILIETDFMKQAIDRAGTKPKNFRAASKMVDTKAKEEISATRRVLERICGRADLVWNIADLLEVSGVAGEALALR